MNIFRLTGDLSHLVAILILLSKIWRTRSCSGITSHSIWNTKKRSNLSIPFFKGISGKSQILFALVFLTRYLDLFTHFISVYNTTMKIFYIASSLGTIYLMYAKFKATYDRIHDTFRVEFLIIPTALLAVFVNHEFEVLEVLSKNILVY